MPETFFDPITLGAFKQLTEEHMTDLVEALRPNTVTLPGGREGLDPVTPWMRVWYGLGRFSAAGVEERVIADQLSQPVDGALALPLSADLTGVTRLVVRGVTETLEGTAHAWERTLAITSIPPLTAQSVQRAILVSEVRA